MQIKAIFFDIDGTLVDSNDMHMIAWEEAFAGVGAAFDRQVIHDQIGKGTDMLVPTLLHNLDKAAQEKLGEAHGSIFKAKFMSKAQPFRHAHDLVVASTGSDEVKQTKPAPDIFSMALAKLPNIGADQAIVGGDAPMTLRLRASAGSLRSRSGPASFPIGCFRLPEQSPSMTTQRHSLQAMPIHLGR